MSRKCFPTVLIALLAASVWLSCSATSFARFHGHRRYPTGSSPTYPNATPHGGFSSSNSYYSGRSRIADAPPPAPKPAPPQPAPAK